LHEGYPWGALVEVHSTAPGCCWQYASAHWTTSVLLQTVSSLSSQMFGSAFTHAKYRYAAVAHCAVFSTSAANE